MEVDVTGDYFLDVIRNLNLYCKIGVSLIKENISSPANEEGKNPHCCLLFCKDYE